MLIKRQFSDTEYRSLRKYIHSKGYNPNGNICTWFCDGVISLVCCTNDDTKEVTICKFELVNQTFCFDVFKAKVYLLCDAVFSILLHKTESHIYSEKEVTYYNYFNEKIDKYDCLCKKRKKVKVLVDK